MPARQISSLFSIHVNDGHEIPVRAWPVSGKTAVKGVIHISHGMAEHSMRYASTAKLLNKAGFHVYAHDHRGHGLNCETSTPGFYAETDGWKKVTEDLAAVQKHIENQHPELPRFLLGHSMGSFITMGYLTTQPSNLQGVILSGSNYDPTAKYHALRPILKAEKIRIGSKGRSPIVEMLTFGSFNKPYEPSESKFEWLSRLKDTVTQYETDPYCGFFSTNQLWEDLINGLISTYSNNGLARIPSDLPIYLFAGDKDPVGDMGKGVVRLTKQLLNTGHTDIAMKLYPNGRHEMLNETNADIVVSDLVAWLKQKAGVAMPTSQQQNENSVSVAQ